MTKNEDVSWMPKPVGRSLKRVATADLINELATREGVTKYPKYVTSEEVFNHRYTLPGNCVMLVVKE